MKIIIWVVVIAIVIIGFFALSSRNETTPTPTTEETPGETVKKESGEMMDKKEGETMGETMEKGATVTYENNAFNPQTVTVKVGEKVTFINKHGSPIRVSSNPHPIHTSYKNLESDRLEPGQSYVFTATEKVTISYHNHFNPGAEGKIIVE